MQSAQITAKESWERGEFPIVCETCLGSNPYVRMMRINFDKECKICARPFTIFRWRPGSDSRYKKTEICQTCAKMKNVCQTCLLDLELGLPVQARDAVLGLSEKMEKPISDVNREWQAELAEKQVEQGLAPFQSTAGKMEMRQQILRLARSEPYYKRNKAHICSFFLKGECKRGSECPYRHEIPEESDLSKQKIKDRYYGHNDPVAKKLLNKLKLTKLVPPTDTSVKTLYIGNVRDTITEQDIRDVFYAYGEIREIKIVPESLCAFITYATREDAEKAASQLYNNLKIKDISCRLSWGKPEYLDEPSTTPKSTVQQSNTSSNNFFSIPTSQTMPPPPNPLLAKPRYPSMNPNRFGGKRDR